MTIDPSFSTAQSMCVKDVMEVVHVTQSRLVTGVGIHTCDCVCVCVCVCVKDVVEVVRVTLVGSNTESRLMTSLESLIETTQDFTDSAYTTHDHRQQILMVCEQLRHQLSVVVRVGASLVRERLCVVVIVVDSFIHKSTLCMIVCSILTPSQTFRIFKNLTSVLSFTHTLN